MTYGRQPMRGPPPQGGAPQRQGGGGGGGPPVNLLAEVYRLQLAIWSKMKNLDVRLQRIEEYQKQQKRKSLPKIDQLIEAMNESNQELSDMRIRLHRIEDLLEKIEQK